MGSLREGNSMETNGIPFEGQLKEQTVMYVKRKLLVILCFLLFVSTACSSLIAAYSQRSYENAVSLKVETLALMSRATTPYSDNRDRIERLSIDIDIAYEYVKGIDNNALAVKQWKILKDSDGKLLGKFFKKWEKKSTLKAFYINEFKGLVRDAFDEIICLEMNKNKSQKCKKDGGE